ncbi:MAG: polysaccharide deacetylase family protein [Acidobacteriota bacterium]
MTRTPPPSPRSRPVVTTPLVRASQLAHFAALLIVFVRPDLWALLLGLLVGNHALLMSQGLWPKSRSLGPNRLGFDATTTTVALTFDDGPEPGPTQEVLELLRATDHRATFFLIGERARRYPELVRRIVEEGHELANHTESHPYWFCIYPPWMLRREVESCQQFLTTFATVRWFRAPAGLRNVFLERTLALCGLHLATWTHRGFDTARGDAERVLGDLSRDLEPGSVLLLHDAGSAQTAEGRPVTLAVLPELLEELEIRGLRSVTLSDALASETSASASPVGPAAPA